MAATSPWPWAGGHGAFNGTGGLVEVQGDLSFKGLQFVADSYALAGGGMLETEAGGGELRVLAGATATIGTRIGGTGAIVKTQDGTLVLTGANTNAGGTRIEDGVVAVAADDALGQAGGALTLDGGVLRVTGDSYRATDRTVLVGVDGGGFDIAAAGHVFTLGRGILGGGELYKLGASTLALAGDNAGFAGSATVTDGRLTVGAGGLGGPISVQSGGTLGGSGTLGGAGAAVTIAAGGVHAPGEGLGRQAVLGDYVLRGTLQIDGAPAAVGGLVAQGRVDIAGSTIEPRFSPAAAEGWSAIAYPFIIIDNQGTGAVSGTFAAVDRNLLFLDPQLNHAGGDGNDVTLELVRRLLRIARAHGQPVRDRPGDRCPAPRLRGMEHGCADEQRECSAPRAGPSVGRNPCLGAGPAVRGGPFSPPRLRREAPPCGRHGSRQRVLGAGPWIIGRSAGRAQCRRA
ncbi:autotransporter-associated beta strand repeat-containing protein [Paracoccus versutus]|uniref:autotransporter-associated beta strand repeat-containing protein n=1 Tax=Paracoccus versutus TaxID=34007 RepID=UPI000DF77F8A|nr:autotransporter-associated beta strand repeat-containing protein [Paracoccus versutus]RDD69291.1 hypothetical protein DVR11_22430 [Paracoccus versutus]